MKRAIYIICEGQTEEEFVNGILRPYFNTHQIYDVRPILMSTSKGHKGGDIKYARLKFNIENYVIKVYNFLKYNLGGKYQWKKEIEKNFGF